MMTSMILFVCLSVTIFHFAAVSAQTFTLSEEATGPSSVCEGSDVTLQCVIMQTNPDNSSFVTSSVWSRDGMPVQVNNASGSFLIANHSVVFNSDNGGFTDLVITDVRLEDDNTVYTCSAASSTIASSVVLNVTEIPAIEGLTAVDKCDVVTVNWEKAVIEGVCENLSYNVTLMHSGHVTSSAITNLLTHIFENTSNVNESCVVKVFAVNGNAVGNANSAYAFGDQIDLPTVTNIRNVSRMCVTSFNITWDPPNITCGEVFYNVSVTQPTIEGDVVEIATLLADRFLNISGLDNSLSVAITVNASNRVESGIVTFPLQLPMPVEFICRDFPKRCNVTPPSFKTPDNVIDFDPMISWKEPTIDPCTTLPIVGYYINITVMLNGSQVIYTSRFINDTTENSMGMFTFSYSELFNETLVPNAIYVLTVVPANMPNPESNGDDDRISDGTITVIATTSVGGVTIIFICSMAIIHCMGILFCIERFKKKREEGSSNKGNCCTTSNFFLISSLGLGYVFLKIHSTCCREKNRGSSVQQGTEMSEKSGDLYDAPVKPKADQEKDQGLLYDYARTGPVNVVIPGSANS